MSPEPSASSPEPPGQPAVPADVVIARVVKAHTRALVALAGTAVLLALLGVAALSLAGAHGRDAPMLAGLTLLGAGQLLAMCAAAVVLRGLLRILRGSGEPGSPQAAQAARNGQPAHVLRGTATAMVTMIKIVLATAVLGIIAWAVLNPGGLIGAIVGAILVVQVAVFIGLIRAGVLHRSLNTLHLPPAQTQ